MPIPKPIVNGFSPDGTVSIVCPAGRSGTAPETSQPVTLNLIAGDAAAIPMNKVVTKVEVNIMSGRGGNEEVSMQGEAMQ